MNPLTPYLLWIKIGGSLALVAALVGYHLHSVSVARAAGVASESARRDIIDLANTQRAQTELLAANERTRKAQANLAIAQEDLQKLSVENNREKLVSSQHKSDLLAGRERLRVLTARAAPGDSAQAGPVASPGAADLDQGPGLVVDLDPAVAAGLEGFREQHNEAVRRLDACVLAYDGVKAAADAQ